jgi:putative ABC transport system permease protein
MNLSLIRVIHLGIRSLMLHKMRSLLTMLGIIFGVCSVIAMLAIGEGASFEAQEAIRELGSRNVIIRSVPPPKGQTTADTVQTYTANYGLKLTDIKLLEETLHPRITDTLAKRRYRMSVRAGRVEISGTVWGTQPNHLRMSQMELITGRFLLATDAHANVCVITDSMAAKLFPISDPLQGKVKLNNWQIFRVVGVVRETAAASVRTPGQANAGRALDANVYIPLAAAHARLGVLFTERTSGGRLRERVELHELVVELADVDQVEATVPAIRAALKTSHRKVDYEIIVPLELLRQAEKTKRIFSIVLGSIAGISLIVGGIGIMNIMLATVTERTREIGIRRALGAQKGQIITQFLVETVVLSIAGGLVGVVFGVALPFAVEYFAEMKTIVTLPAVLLAFGISAVVGVVFGVYPARRAAELDPIEALRHT